LALPAGLMAAAVKAVVEAPPARVVTLTEEVLRAMFVNKLKVLLAAVLAAAVLSVTAAIAVTRLRAAEPAAEPKADTRPARRPGEPGLDRKKLRATLLALEKQAWEATQKRDF